MPKSDQQLIAECLEGQTHVFGDLVLRYQDRLYHMLVHVLGSAEDARDVAQETFVSAFQKLRSFQGRSAFYSWLFRIAMNSAVSRQRKTKRAPISIDAVRHATGREPTDPHPEARPEYSIESNERQVAVRTALADLPEEFRTVLILKEMENMKYDEIAEIVGCPIGTVRSRIHRARAELKARLVALWHEPVEE